MRLNPSETKTCWKAPPLSEGERYLVYAFAESPGSIRQSIEDLGEGVTAVNGLVESDWGTGSRRRIPGGAAGDRGVSTDATSGADINGV